LRLLQKKYPRGIADDGARRRASAALSRSGYTWEDIKQALKNYGTDEQDAD
jgi:SOS response regulatory protein OraA/RecX